VIVGCPKEIKDNENRVGLTPGGVWALEQAGHTVLVETGAGGGSHFSDDEYQGKGAEIVSTAAEVWARSKLVVKVKEPLPSEYGFFRDDLVLFTYLHLAPAPELTKVLLDSGIVGINSAKVAA
jgi:alanine dehydrogenase